jgi:hypothetical protein
MKIAQTNYNDANRQLFAAESCVARVLKISHHEAGELLKQSAIDRKIEESGVEVYHATSCRSPWPDTQTFGVWAFMVGGSMITVWAAGVI